MGGQRKSRESVESCILAVWEKLARMAGLVQQNWVQQVQQLVQQNLAQAQKWQKTLYDTKAHMQELKPGCDVLIILPTLTNKLLTKWQEP